MWALWRRVQLKIAPYFTKEKRSKKLKVEYTLCTQYIHMGTIKTWYLKLNNFFSVSDFHLMLTVCNMTVLKYTSLYGLSYVSFVLVMRINLFLHTISEMTIYTCWSYILRKELTSIWAPDRLARSKQQLDRLAFARSVFLRFAILKLIKRRSSLERSAESKFIPCGMEKVTTALSFRNSRASSVLREKQVR